MPPQSAQAPPDPDELVLVRYGDLADLQVACAGAGESLVEAKEDLKEILAALQITVDTPATGHQIVVDVILPRVRQLVATHGLVVEAEQQLRDRASLLAVPEIDLGDGRKAQLAGRRIPEEHLRAVGLSSKGLRKGRHRR